jgi:hypothetical protein
MLDAYCAGNPAALKTSGTTLRIRWLASARSKDWKLCATRPDKQPGGRAGPVAPGFVIIVEHPGGTTTTIGPRQPQPQVIEHEPADEAEAD